MNILKFSLFENKDLDMVEKTILFTDIKGSSDLWGNNEDAMFKALDKHEKQILNFCKDYDGVVLKSIGDSYMIVFDELENAVEFAITLQKDLNENKIKVGKENIQLRIGICGGKVYEKVVKRQDKDLVDYFGDTVNIASRMESKVCEVGDVAFTYNGKRDKIEIDGYDVDAIDFKENCRIGSRKRSERLLTDVHNYMCKNVSNLKGVSEVIAYKIKIYDEK